MLWVGGVRVWGPGGEERFLLFTYETVSSAKVSQKRRLKTHSKAGEMAQWWSRALAALAGDLGSQARQGCSQPSVPPIHLDH